MAKKETKAAQKKRWAAEKKAHAARIKRNRKVKMVGLKNYRCGEPGTEIAPPPALEKLMVKHWGPHSRLFVGGIYPMVPGELADALTKEQAAKEF